MIALRRSVLAAGSSGFIPPPLLSLVLAGPETGSFFRSKDGHLKVAATFFRRAACFGANSGGSAA